jgi:mRNA-degrading endonuclease RelE of RelBE toxin-antitoxin system
MINEALLSQVSVGLAEVQVGGVHHWTLGSALEDLRKIWNPSSPSKKCEAARDLNAPNPFYLAESLGAADPSYEAKPRPKRPPPWYLGWSSSFGKAVDKIDRKMQGRILQVLSDIVENPLVVRGDAVKPLTGKLKGCWRYRIGDFRLVYAPDQSTGNITLLAFGARGSVFDD